MNGSVLKLYLYLKIIMYLSIMPVVAKVFERIVYDQVLAYINNHNLITNCQSGFQIVSLDFAAFTPMPPLYWRLRIIGHIILIAVV
jgi:hypothetical protein